MPGAITVKLYGLRRGSSFSLWVRFSSVVARTWRAIGEPCVSGSVLNMCAGRDGRAWAMIDTSACSLKAYLHKEQQIWTALDLWNPLKGGQRETTSAAAAKAARE